MNTRKVVSLSGTVLLAAVAVFVGRASTRFTSNPAKNLFVSHNGCIATSLTGGTITGSNFLTTGGSGAPASIKTSTGGGNFFLFSTSNCGPTHRVNFTLP